MKTANHTPAQPKLSWYHWALMPVAIGRFFTPLGWLALAVIVAINLFVTTLFAGGTIVSVALGGVGLAWFTGTTIGLGAKIVAVILAVVIWFGFWLLVTLGMAFFLFVLTMMFLVFPYFITNGQINPIKFFINLDSGETPTVNGSVTFTESDELLISGTFQKDLDAQGKNVTIALGAIMYGRITNTKGVTVDGDESAFPGYREGDCNVTFLGSPKPV